jgi:hypothetical protein
VEDTFVDDVDSRDFETKDFASEDLDEMIIYGDSSAISPDIKPVPFNDDTDGTQVSHSPLNLGDGGAAEAPEIEPAAKPANKVASSERVTGVKTFFTKLHPGAMDFLDKQITNWLRSNPGLKVKRTNMTTGEVQGKKSEPNIIITVWY